jgi:hypothetical protein
MPNGENAQLLSSSAANNFVDPHTALSFPAASGGITMAWKVAGRLDPSLFGPTQVWFPVLISAFVGLAFYFVSRRRETDIGNRLQVLVAAFFNTVTLAAAVLGLGQVIEPQNSYP